MPVPPHHWNAVDGQPALNSLMKLLNGTSYKVNNNHDRQHQKIVAVIENNQGGVDYVRHSLLNMRSDRRPVDFAEQTCF
jgi:hypothetical protein